MVKKILKYGIGIIVIVILLILALIFKPSPQNEKDSNTEENKTIEEQVQETLSLDPNDENIIGYIRILFKFKIKFQNCFKKHSLTYKKQDDIILI